MRVASVVVLLFALSPFARADSPTHLKLASTPSSILDGQLALSLPVGMSVERVDRTLSTGTKPGWREEASSTLDLGDDRFTLRAYETFAAMGHKFRSDIVVDLRGQGVERARIQKLALRDPLVGYEILPKRPKPSLVEFAFIYGAYIARRDGTVQVFAFYLRGDAAHVRAWTALARTIAKTVAPGDHPPDFGAGKKPLGHDLAVTTPAGWTTTVQLGSVQGPVGILHLREIATSLAMPAASCALAIDVSRRRATTGAEAARRVLGRELTWTESDASTPAVMTTSIDHAWHSLPLDITCTAPTHEDLADIREMLRTLRQD